MTATPKLLAVVGPTASGKSAVAEALAAAGIDWKQLRLIACGDSERIIPRAEDAAGHARNQRVEVVATQQAPESLE